MKNFLLHCESFQVREPSMGVASKCNWFLDLTFLMTEEQSLRLCRLGYFYSFCARPASSCSRSLFSDLRLSSQTNCSLQINPLWYLQKGPCCIRQHQLLPLGGPFLSFLRLSKKRFVCLISTSTPVQGPGEEGSHCISGVEVQCMRFSAQLQLLPGSSTAPPCSSESFFWAAQFA